MTVFYDHRNHLYARVSYSEAAGGRTLALVKAQSGALVDDVLAEVRVPPGDVDLRADLFDGSVLFSWRVGDGEYSSLGQAVDSSFMPDELVRGFTGQFVGMAAVDSVSRSQVARFTRFALTYEN